MRRLTRLTTAALLAAAALTGCGASPEEERYRVDALFDNAGFLTKGTDVRIGGAKAGEVIGVKLSRRHEARIELEVDRKFAPFRADADCSIQPQSLISEKFVDCAPGTADAKALRTSAETDVPELPVANTHPPVDLDLVLNIFRRPVRERFTLLLDALGSGLAARGEDLNATIRRAAPALQESRRVLEILRTDRQALRTLIESSDVVLGELATGRGRVAAFVRDAGVAAEASGAREASLREAVRRLPAMLSEARPAFADLETFAEAGTPLARELRDAAPGVDKLLGELGPFSQRALPGVERLGTAARKAEPQVRALAPQVRRLRRFAELARPASGLLATLSRSLRDQGVVEGVSNIFYYGATATARFDAHSHMLPAFPLVTQCLLWSSTPVSGCDAHYKSFRGQPAAKRSRKRAARTSERRDEPAAPAAQSAPAPAPAAQAAPAPAEAPKAPAVPAPKLPQLPSLPKLPSVPLPFPKPGGADGAQRPDGGDPASSLLDFLLG